MTAETMTIGEWFQSYPGRGRSCMANPLNAKKPTPGKWQNPNLTDTDLHESFNGKNIGVLLREPSVGRWISI
jgi:hypothetical protein